MSILKTLKYADATKTNDPVMKRRTRFASHLKNQIALAKDDSFVLVERSWKGKGAERHQVEKRRPVRAWWKMTADNSAVITLRAGGKRLELVAGKAIVAPPGELVETLETILAATVAGELDSMLPAPRAIKRMNNNPAANASAAVKAAAEASAAEMKKRSKVPA
jgi:hypothetical protein